MLPFHILLLGLIQGITEFIPVSSSAHLALLSMMANSGSYDGIAVDAAAHLGTLLAVLVYFRSDVIHVLREFSSFVTGKERPKLLGYLVIATLPGMLAGIFLKGLIQHGLSLTLVIGWMSLIFGSLMYAADKWGRYAYTLDHMTYKRAFLIGCAQAFSILPGASRSGTTLSMARLLGFLREPAFRFSFLLSIPITLGLVLMSALDAYKSGAHFLTSETLWLGGLSFVIGYFSLTLVMGWISRLSLAPFALYRIFLGIGLILLGNS